MDAKRISGKIDAEMQELRGKVRAMEAKRQEYLKTVEKAKSDRKRGAFKAHAENDKRAQEQLGRARESQLKAALELEDLEAAVIAGREQFEALERQWKAALRREDLERLKALARERIALAPRVDAVVDGLVGVLKDFNMITEAMLPFEHNLNLRVKLHEDNLREWLRVRLWPITGDLSISKTFGYLRERKTMAELEKDCFQRLLTMDDVPDGGAQPNGHDGPEAEGSGQDQGEEVQAEVGAETEAGPGAQ